MSTNAASETQGEAPHHDPTGNEAWIARQRSLDVLVLKQEMPIEQISRLDGQHSVSLGKPVSDRSVDQHELVVIRAERGDLRKIDGLVDVSRAKLCEIADGAEVPDGQWHALRAYARWHCTVSWKGSRKAVKSEFGRRCPARRGRPIEVRAVQILPLPPRGDGVGREVHLGNGQIAPRRLEPEIEVFGNNAVHPDSIAPGLGCVDVVEELIESGDLRRLKRLIDDQLALHGLEVSEPQAEKARGVPLKSQFWIEPFGRNRPLLE